MSARIWLVAAGAFAVGTSAYVVSGVLPAVSRDLHVSLTVAGQLTTAFALSYAIGSPILASLTGRWDRRTLLVAALVLAAVGNLIAAVAADYPTLIVGRVVAALGAAAYTPAATLVATGFLPPEERGRALAMVFGGLTFALVVGVPAGSLLGDRIGFRGVFGLIAAVALLVAFVLRLVVPRVDAPPAVAFRDRFAIAADRKVQTVLVMTVLVVLGSFSVYVYIVPLLRQTGGLTGDVVGVLLLVYGLGAMLGNWIGGRATDRFGSMRSLLVTLSGAAITVLALEVTATTVIGAAVTLFLWSAFTWGFNPPVQNLLLDLGRGNGLLLALNASAIYVGAGLSAVVGGLVIQFAGLQYLPVLATALGIAVLLLALTLRASSTTTRARRAGVLYGRSSGR